MNEKQEIWSWLILAAVVASLLLYAVAGNSQELKRRTEPAIRDESCRDHLYRLQKEFIAIAQTKRQAKDLSQSTAFQPSPDTCTKANQRTLELQLAIWKFDIVSAASLFPIDPQSKP